MLRLQYLTENLLNMKITDSRLEKLSDATLHTEDGYVFRIHKIALADYSRYFFALFCGMGKGKVDYLIPGVGGEVLSNILSYIYTGEIEAHEFNICDIIMASDYLLLDDLFSQMKTLVEKNISVVNCLAVHLCLLQVNRNDLLSKSYRFIATHFEELMCCMKEKFRMDEAFYALPLELLKQLFNDRNLRVQNENVVWQAIVKWVEADISNRLYLVPDLLMCLRTGDIDENLATEILTHPIVSWNTYCVTNFITPSCKSSLLYHQCHVWNDTSFFPSNTPRKPLRLNFIACYSPRDQPDVTEASRTSIYVTYDENVDLWRKIMEFHLRPSYVVCVHDCIYVFEATVFGGATKLCYNYINKQWVMFRNFRIRRYGYVVVTLGVFLYILGGHDITTNYHVREIYNVEVYDPKESAWHDTTPMLPIVKCISAVTLNDRIYVVGRSTEHTGMSAQVYDPAARIWNEIPHPSIDRCISFELVAYNCKIYMIGKSAEYDVVEVEVFDPLLNAWYAIQNVPYTYSSSMRALVIDDKLIVCDCDEFNAFKKDPPVQWNSERGSWQTLPKSSPLFNINRYFFSSQGDSINVISKENKKPTTVFEKSPFALSV